MAAHPKNETSRRSIEHLSLGPDCAALASIGTVYLYRLGAADILAYGEFHAALATPIARFRALLPRIASTSVSDKGAAAAGPLTHGEVASLNDDEIERLAEAWLESSNIRWYQQDAASASPGLLRHPGESALPFVDRLISWYARNREPQPVLDAPVAAIAAANENAENATSTPGDKPKRAAVPASWLAMAALFPAAAIALGVSVHNYFANATLRRAQDDMAAQVGLLRATNASLDAKLVRLGEENDQLRRRVSALDSALRTQTAASKAREAKPKWPWTRRPAPGKRPLAASRARFTRY